MTLLRLDPHVESPLWKGRHIRHFTKVVGETLWGNDTVRQALQAQLQGAMPPQDKVGSFSANVVWGDAAMVQTLNATYREKNAPTNVLSFPQGVYLPYEDELALGDIYLAYEIIAQEALGQKKSLADHVRHLMVHGVLHLLGYDHEEEHEAQVMEALEIRLLAHMGLPNPYEDQR